jgi:cobalt-zinc-cadmium efflux system membrane fusion protein
MIRNLFFTATCACLLALQGCGSKADPSESPAAQSHEEDEAGHGDGKVMLTPEQIQRADIRIAQAGAADLREHLSLYGVIAPNAERVLEVAARFPGMIQSVKRRVGDPVRRGETLATVESNESLQTYPVVSPMDGVVTMRNANEGAQAGEGALFTVADLSTVWVELSIFPRDLAKVRIGQEVRVRSVDTGLESEGKLVYVAPFGSSSNQTLTARVQLPNPDRKWPPGLYVNADVVLSSTRVPLAVQNSAIQTLNDRTVVFVRAEDGFEPRIVKLGRSDGEISEVLEGVAAGDSYATHNSFILKAELGKGEAEHED